MDTTLTEGWVRGQWAVLHSLTVPESNTGAIRHSSQARTTGLARWISCHMGSMTLKRKLELVSWHCVAGWHGGLTKRWCASNSPFDRENFHT